MIYCGIAAAWVAFYPELIWYAAHFWCETLFLTLTDLAAAPDVRLDRELDKVARAFWSASWPSAVSGARVGKATSRLTIDAHFRWFEENVIRVAGLAFLDPRRAFNVVEKEAIWTRSKGVCALCQLPLSLADVEFDHIVPWIRGGPTGSDNGQAVHRACNRRRGEGQLDDAA